MKKIIFSTLTMVFSLTLCYSQDIITKKNGEDLKTKVIEITSTEIKYKNFDNQNGPTYSILKSDVFMIKYENGTKDVFKEETPSVNNSNYPVSDKNKKEKTELKGANIIQLSIGLFNPLREELTNFSGIPPIIFSYERNLSEQLGEQLSLGGMFIYTRGEGDYSYFYNLLTDKISARVIFLGALGNYHIYTTDNLDITGGAVLGFVSITYSDGEKESVASTRFNAAINYYLSSNFGLFARVGNWGQTLAFDLGTTIKF